MGGLYKQGGSPGWSGLGEMDSGKRNDQARPMKSSRTAEGQRVGLW